MTKYKKRPQEISAIKYEGTPHLESLMEFMGDDFNEVLLYPASGVLLVGDRRVSIGDYIIRDIKLGYVVMPSDKFEYLYEKSE